MKSILLAGGPSIHTVRWANALADAGIDIVLVTQHDVEQPLVRAVKMRRLPYSGSIGYFRNVPAVKRIIAEEKPDLVNAHYASGYGTTARLAGFTPTLLSVWGSDVYDFPEKSPLHRWWLKGNLRSAARVASTGHVMADRVRQLVPDLGEIAVTPFGVATDQFAPAAHEKLGAPQQPIVIGTVKALTLAYGIDLLIESFALLVQNLRQEAPRLAERLQLRIVGDGGQKDALERLAATRGIDAITQFVPRIAHDAVPAALRELDIYVALSRQESFGVAIIEAGACGLPVVVSDVGGLPEVVANGETGIIVPKENPAAAAEALRKLVLDADLRRQLGEAGRRRVISLYQWDNNVRHMIDLYAQVIAHSGEKMPR